MSDQPLFQHIDEQEAIFGPEDLPEDSAQHQAAALDNRGRDGDATIDEVGVPAAGAGLLGQTGGGFGASTGSTNPAGTSVVAAAPEDETRGPEVDDE